MDDIPSVIQEGHRPADPGAQRRSHLHRARGVVNGRSSGKGQMGHVTQTVWQSLWELLGFSLGVSAKFWEFVGTLGTFWDLLGTPGNFWELLGRMFK